MSLAGIVTLDYGRPVVLVRVYCWPCQEDDHEVEVSIDSRAYDELAPLLEHESRCLNTGAVEAVARRRRRCEFCGPGGNGGPV